MSDNFDKALELAKKLLETPDNSQDVRWEMVDDLLQRGCLAKSQFRFLERYLQNYLSFHLHFSIHLNGMAERRVLCAVFNFDSKHSTSMTQAVSCNLVRFGDDSRCGEMSVLIDVREFCQDSQHLMDIIPTVVRL